MTFTFKLARRLAVSHRAALVLPVGILAACGGSDSLAPAAASTAGSRAVLTPRNATLSLGRTLQFAAFQRLEGGDSVPAANVSWTASGGLIQPTGVFRAEMPGNYRVIGHVTNGAAESSDTAVVQVIDTAASQPPSPADPSALRRHEPGGMSLITARDFDRPGEQGWLEGPRSGLVGFVRDQQAPTGAGSVGQIKFPAGFAGGAAPAFAAREELPQDRRFRTTYVSYWVKISANWYGHPVVNKIGFVWIGGKPKCDPAIKGAGTGPLYFQMRLQNLAGQLDVNLPNNLGSGAFARGQWHHVELVLVANTAGSAAPNGEAHWWLDDEPVGSATNIAWVGAGEGDTWETFSWWPVWGGLGQNVPADQYMWMDQYYASGK